MSSRCVQPKLLLLGAVALAFAPRDAHAWDSRCYEYADPSLEPTAYGPLPHTPCAPDAGPNTARHRWIGELDEHRFLFEVARGDAGLPIVVSRTRHMPVFVAARSIQVGGRSYSSISPAAWTDVSGMVQRHFSPGEFSELPDYSFGLWDWINGHESCPLGAVANDGSTTPDAETCHAFAVHMGALNANHFLPQAELFYRYYHGLALTRAQVCRSMQTTMGSSASRFDDVLQDCELEALSLEAVALHFLQDAWSTGHMWERWGSPDPAQLPGRNASDRHARASLVALAAGLFHGARASLQALPTWTTYDVNDPLNAPHPLVEWSSDGGATRFHGLGDDYLGVLYGLTVPEDPIYQEQSLRLRRCGASSIRAVYAATSQVHGELGPTTMHLDAESSHETCFAQRVTNQSLLVGGGIHFRVLGEQAELPLNAQLTGMLLPTTSVAASQTELTHGLAGQFRLELQRTATMLRILTHERPTGIEAASGGLGPLLGLRPNGSYELPQNAMPAPYLDPMGAWPAAPGTQPDELAQRASLLGRFFHKSHANEWCAALDLPSLEALKARAHAPGLSPEAQAASCGVCTELVQRHLRVGSPRRWDRTQEPLCSVLAPTTSAVVYQASSRATTSPRTAAQAWCGCSP